MAATAWYRLLTGPGRGPIGVIGLWGPAAEEVIAGAFRSAMGREWRGCRPGSIRFGRIVGAGGEAGDEVVVVRLVSDEPAFEIQGHGGRAAIEQVRQALESRGAVEAAVGSMGRAGMTRLRAQAWDDLKRATTRGSAEFLLSQFHGMIEHELKRLSVASDDELREGVGRLIERGEATSRCVSGWRVALAGRPNAGKSRLMNAVAGYERSIVASEAGTTRDVVTARLAIGGWPVEVADTAGLRETLDPVEAEGNRRAGAAHREADLVVLLLAADEPENEEDQKLAAENPEWLVIESKCDLTRVRARPEGRLSVSAVTGEGIEALLEEIGKRLGIERIDPSRGGLFRERQVKRARRIQRMVDAGRFDEARGALLRWAVGRPRSWDAVPWVAGLVEPS